MIIDTNKQLSPVYRMMAESKYTFEVVDKVAPIAHERNGHTTFITYAENHSVRRIISEELELAKCVYFPVNDGELAYDRDQSNSIGYRYEKGNEHIIVYILTDYAEYKLLRSIWLKASEQKAYVDLSFRDFADSAKILASAGLLNFNQAKKGK